MKRGRKVILGILAVWLLMAGPAWSADKVAFMLDWYPNPDHVPLYLAAEAGFFKDEGLEVDIIPPADPNDPLKLVAAGKIPFAVNYQPGVIMARAEGLKVVSIGALVQHPLSCILFLKSSGFKTPADLKGRRVGYSVDPLYRVLFEAVAEKAGLGPKDYELIRVGFNLTPPLLSGQVDAVCGAFKNYEAIQVELEGKAAGIFALEEHGVPDFYELVLITNAEEIKARPARVQAFMRAVTKGIERTLADPQGSFEVFLKKHPDLRNELNRRSYQASLASFKGSPAQDGAKWEKFQEFMLKRRLIEKPMPLTDMIWPGK
ncbi:MAG: ABC transporter substrate-binding protein [Thermodesulfobacteriota bacterium]